MNEDNQSNYRFNLIALEEAALKAYKDWTVEDNQITRTGIFNTVKELSFAILMVHKGYAKYGIDYEKCSYEYALYLFDRIVFGKEQGEGKEPIRFKLIPKDLNSLGFPLQKYISLNIKHVIFSMKEEISWPDVLKEVGEVYESVIDAETIHTNNTQVEEKYSRNFISQKILEVLRIYYSYEEIRRLIHLSLDIVFNNDRYSIINTSPVDLKDFTITMIAVAKRIVKEDVINNTLDIKKDDLKKILNAAVRSTVFLSTVVNSTLIPKELLLALDIDSLYRLVSLMGGKTLKIPNSRELDTMLGSVVAISQSIMEGKDPKKSLQEAKQDMNLVFTQKIDINSFISKAIDSYNVFKDDKTTDPIITILSMSIKSLDILFKTLEEKAGELPPESILSKYVELCTSFSKFTETLINIKNNLPDTIKLIN
jgi:hypothetical protein